MFQDEYKKAYNSIRPDEALVNTVLDNARTEINEHQKFTLAGLATKKMHHRRTRFFRPLIAAAACCLCLCISMPVFAAKSPHFYRAIAHISPKLADILIPIEKTSSSQGITLEVEGIHIEGNRAEILVSLRDDEDSDEDKINGKADLFDSYRFSSHSGESTLGGCSYLSYDAESGKAYFNIDVQSENQFDTEKLNFSVSEIITELSAEEKPINLSAALSDADLKNISISGRGGIMKPEEIPEAFQKKKGTVDDPRPQYQVLDTSGIRNCAPDDFTITGIAYMNGGLRVQICMGDLSHSDRHVQPFLVDKDGNERNNDYSVSWHEENDGITYDYYEYWFFEDIENLKDYSMYGIFHESGESIRGDWDVTFRMK